LPRLPSFESLGEARTFESGRPTPGVDGSAVGRAMEGFGQSLQRAGDRGMAYVEGKRNEDARLQATDAKVGWLTGTLDFDKQFDDADPEFEKWPDRGRAELTRLRDEQAQKIADPRLRQQFVLQSEPDIARQLSRLNDRVKARGNDVWWSTKNQELTTLQDRLHDDPDEQRRTDGIRAAEEIIRQARVRGLIKSDTDAAETARRWREGYQERGLWRLPAAERLDALQGPAKDVRGVALRIVGAESNFRADAKNPNSTATGAGQFIESTWLDTVGKHRPDLTAGKSRQEILDLRKNYDVAVEMTQRHLEDNAKELQKSGFDATPGNLYLAHFAGNAGAKSVLRAADTDDAASAMASASAGKQTREQLIKANPFLAGMTVADLKAWSERKMGGGRAGQLAAGLSPDTRTRIAAASEKEVLEGMRQGAIQAERSRAAWVDSRQFAASKGEYSAADAERDFLAGRFKSFEEYNGVVRIAKAAEAEVSALDSFVRTLQEGGVVNPRDANHKAGLEALDAKTGLTDALARGEGDASQQASQLFGRTGMVTDRQKGLFEGAIRSGTPQQLEFTMSTLDQMYRRNPEAFSHAFSKDTFKTLQMWQSRIDRDPKAFREELTRAMDPANIKAREELEKRGREIVKNMDDKALIKVFDESWLPFTDPNAPQVTKDFAGIGVLRQEYADLFAEGYATFADEKQAKDFADKRIKMTWASSDVGGGRLMKYAPEALTDILPKFNGDTKWMQEQIAERLRSISPVVPRNYALVSTPNTKAEIDALRAGAPLPNKRTSPGWALVYLDPQTAELRYAGDFSFDVELARDKHMFSLRDQREQEKQRLMSVEAASEAGLERAARLKRQTLDLESRATAPVQRADPIGDAMQAARIGRERDLADESEGAAWRREARQRRRGGT
jgi:hypothetical protein